MSTDDIEQWVNGLRGKQSRPTSHIDAETALIRKLVQDAQPPLAADDQTEHAYQRLLFRLRRESLIGKAAPAWLPTARQSIAAAVAVIGIGMVTMLHLDQSESDGTLSEMMRGDEQAQKVVVTNPRQVADEMVKAFKARNVMVRQIDETNGIRLQAQVSKEVRLEMAATLADLGVAIPEHGRLDVLLATKP